MSSDSVTPDSGSEAARIAELEAEVAHLQDQVAHPATAAAGPSGSRWRAFWSAVCITLACLLAPLSIVAVWSKGEVTDTERYVATVAPLASDPAIQQAVSDRVTTEVLSYLNIEELTQEAISAITANRDLTPRQTAALTALAGPLDSGIEGFVGDKVTEIVQSDLFEATWTEANTRAHDRLNQVLSGDNTGPVSIQGNDVTLDLGQVVAQVKQALIDKGLTVAEKIPTVNTQMVIFQSDNLATAQRAYSLLNTLGFWLPIIAIALALVGVLLARHRHKAVIGLGVGLAISSLVSGALVAVGRTEYLNALPDTVNSAAATTLFDTVTYFLRQTLWASMAAAIVLLLAGILTGPSRFGQGVRGLCVSAAAAIQGQLASWGAGMDSARHWVAGNAGGLRIGATLLAVAYVALTRYKTVSLVLWTTVVLLIVLFVIQIFASDKPPATTADDESDASAATPATS